MIDVLLVIRNFWNTFMVWKIFNTRVFPLYIIVQVKNIEMDLCHLFNVLEPFLEIWVEIHIFLPHIDNINPTIHIYTHFSNLINGLVMLPWRTGKWYTIMGYLFKLFNFWDEFLALWVAIHIMVPHLYHIDPNSHRSKEYNLINWLVMVLRRGGKRPIVGLLLLCRITTLFWIFHWQT